MLAFVALAAAMVLTALLAVLFPLLRRSQRPLQRGEDLAVLADGLRELDAQLAAGDVGAAEHERARLELQRQALHAGQAAQARARSSQQANWAVALATAVVLPLLAIGVYLTVGQPGAIHPSAPAARSASTGAAPHVQDDAAVAALQARLARDGGDAEGWVLLARSYYQMGRIDDALSAYGKATQLSSDNADLWVEYANTLAIAQQRDLSGEPTRMVQRALEIDPNNFNALAFAGLAAFQQNDRTAALAHWQKLKALLPADTEDARRIDSLIARARGQAPAAPLAASAQAAKQTGDATIRGTVTLDERLRSQVAAADTLFIFARASDGPPMPLAAVRTRASGWPVSFTLDDSSAMAPEMRLSRFAQVSVVARVSRLGTPAAQPGDIEGRVEQVALGSKEVRIVLDRVVER
ncbi:c-type cytochrome biogenesis protein CcmI [Comamonas sp. NLF-1-9]|uniref:c-type cytochrome biogenesis protein CcmI n=1 Tax=Comamonas sp. NLF-1-9 TaxID=2853163 RepID=UPI001C488F29|nr:c-type cytochrome biogenesis protein CcmI [Comamonas sp. NLF-1-9]QXL85415.1 c-type cytochrome biogenesis protein CcmI [Comamonas sp. NLF-1-9]